MKILSIQEAYLKKFARQNLIKELQYDAAGHCVHIGKLSPGCEHCFIKVKALNIPVGQACNLKCPYCPTKGDKLHRLTIRQLKTALMRQISLENFYMQKVSFTGQGEPLLYLDYVSKVMGLLHGLKKYIKKRPWYYLYTNGKLLNMDTILKLKELGFDEVRFHLGASNFSQDVYKNMERSVKHFRAITVETPSWPPHRKKLFEMLPIIESIGVKHLNIGDIVVNKFNYKTINRSLPDAEIYQCSEMYLYDNGLVYDIIEKALEKGYSYSILDCSCFVKSIQHSYGKWVLYQNVENLCTKYKL
ncbi:MAG: radical SAM protein [Candidatus Omnitrophica bacterium]|nr:radical SAM protein [Candidatus Omnitrophota bacterium]